MTIVIILCLGLMIIPNAEEAEGGYLQWDHASKDSPECIIINNSDTNIHPLSASGSYLRNVTEVKNRYLVSIGNFSYNPEKYTLVEFALYVEAVTVAGNVSVYRMKHDQFMSCEANWTNSRNGQGWGTPDIPGGGYWATALDTINISTTGFTYFNITDYTIHAGDEKGLIFIAESGTNITVKGMNFNSFVRFYHEDANEGSATTITKDIWNLEGFVNLSSKKASAIYSEISNCKAIVYKNSTGYYYTYAPTWGLLEDYDISFGDGLFILTTADTTWDHT